MAAAKVVVAAVVETRNHPFVGMPREVVDFVPTMDLRCLPFEEDMVSMAALVALEEEILP